MNILICMKQILDPEIPSRDFRIDAARKVAEQGSANLVTNIFCENALETALQFREKAGEGKITVLSYGPATAEDTLRKALAMKADAAALVLSDGEPQRDPLTVAQILAAAARKLGVFDLILTGRESGDWGTGQTGGLLAEELGVPCVSFVDSIELREKRRADSPVGPGPLESGPHVIRLKRQTESGFEIVEAQPPLVLTITNDEHNVPRIPKVRDVMMAHKQTITTWNVSDLGVDPTSRYYEVEELSVPQSESQCEFVPGDTLEQKVEALARRLLEVTSAI
jgi:electron transfer flavoprotein beta subunit